MPVFKAGALLERSSGVSEYSNSKPTTRMDMPRAAPVAMRFTGVRFGPIKAVTSADAELASDIKRRVRISDMRRVLVLLRTLFFIRLSIRQNSNLLTTILVLHSPRCCSMFAKLERTC